MNCLELNENETMRIVCFVMLPYLYFLWQSKWLSFNFKAIFATREFFSFLCCFSRHFSSINKFPHITCMRLPYATHHIVSVLSNLRNDNVAFYTRQPLNVFFVFFLWNFKDGKEKNVLKDAAIFVVESKKNNINCLILLFKFRLLFLWQNQKKYKGNEKFY